MAELLLRELESGDRCPQLGAPFAVDLMADFRPRLLQMHKLGAPLQVGTNDCGVYAVAYMRALLNNEFPAFLQASARVPSL